MTHAARHAGGNVAKHAATSTVTGPVRPVAEHLVGVTLVRAAAAVLIAHGYLVGAWMHEHGEHPAWLAAVREWANRPLRIGEDFGPLGVMLLLLAAGYLAGAAADREPLGGTGFVRAHLPLPVAATLVAAASFFVPGVASLAWVVAIEFVALLVAVATRGRPLWPVTLGLLVAAGVLTVFGDTTEGVARLLCLLPLVVIGLVVWRVVSGALAGWVGLGLGAASLSLVVTVDRTQPAITQWWYPVTAVYAVLLFLAAVMVAGPVAQVAASHGVSRWLADRAEWLALMLGVAGYPVLSLLHHRVPLALAAVAAVLATAAAADACHRLTHRPWDPNVERA